MSQRTCFHSTYTKYCTKCHALEPIDIIVGLDCDGSSDSNKLVADVINANKKDESIPRKCKFCDSNYTIILDDNIAPLVAVLNKKGYKTKYSCEGHISSDRRWQPCYFSTPYVSLVSSIPVGIFDNIPDGWYVEWNKTKHREKYGFGLSIRYLDTNAKSIEDSIEFDSDAIMKWADNLPCNDKEDK